MQPIKVKGDTYYRLSCWVKTENVGTKTKGANICLLGRATQGVTLMRMDEGVSVVSVARIVNDDEEKKMMKKKNSAIYVSMY